MPKLKHLLIGLAVFVVLTAALLTVLGNKPVRPLGGGVMPTDSFEATTFPAPMGIPERSGGVMSKNLAQVAPSDGLDMSSGQDITDKKVIKNGNLTLKVDNADKSAEKISQIAKGNGG